MAKLANDASVAFEHAFRRMPVALASAPGRVNIIGDHTDYNEGFVLPMAIDRRTVVAGAANDCGENRVVSVALGDSQANGFARYVDAVANELRDIDWELPGVDVVIHSNVPIGAGLASSAALTVATATMFEALVGKSLAPLEKAKLCQRAEHRCGTPCGIMDMFVATHAREGCALKLDCRSLAFEDVQLPGELAWIVVNTGVRHALSDGAYAERRATCESAARALGISSLREVTAAQVAQLQGVERKRAAHALSENERVLAMVQALRAVDAAGAGELMFASHVSLAEDFQVSCPELDAVVDWIRDSVPRLGVGARMTGAGFGGCAIVLCAASGADNICRHLERRLREWFGPRCEVFRALPGFAACQLGRNSGGA